MLLGSGELLSQDLFVRVASLVKLMLGDQLHDIQQALLEGDVSEVFAQAFQS